MSATNYQQSAIADSVPFQNNIKASIIKKSLAIIEVPGGYTATQLSRAKQIISGQDTTQYFRPMASSANVVASNITYDFANRVVTSDISEASLDSQVYQVVFVDLV